MPLHAKAAAQPPPSRRPGMARSAIPAHVAGSRRRHGQRLRRWSPSPGRLRRPGEPRAALAVRLRACGAEPDTVGRAKGTHRADARSVPPLSETIVGRIKPTTGNSGFFHARVLAHFTNRILQPYPPSPNLNPTFSPVSVSTAVDTSSLKPSTTSSIVLAEMFTTNASICTSPARSV